MQLPPDLAFRADGQLATGLLVGVLADGIGLDFGCGDEVWAAAPGCGSTSKRPGYVRRDRSDLCLTTAPGVRLTCKQAAARLPEPGGG